MGRLPLPLYLGTPEGYAQASGRRGANLAHLYFKVRGWTAHGYHFPDHGRRQSDPATPLQWELVRFSEITQLPAACHGCGASLPARSWHLCPPCLARARQN